MEAWYGLVAFVAGWLVAQVAKLILAVISDLRNGKKVDFWGLIEHFTRSGGMPSGHTASMVGLTTYYACAYGVNSAIFGLAVATTLIVIYDATHVRYAVGRQCKALNGLLEKEGKPALPVVEGHTVPQVMVGFVIGMLAGIVVFGLAGGKIW